jgi:hypothetical protein
MNEAALGRFGDKRREDLGAVLLDAVESKRTLCIHRLAEDRNQTIRFNNFLANPAVSTHEMLVTAGRKTGVARGHDHSMNRRIGEGAPVSVQIRSAQASIHRPELGFQWTIRSSIVFLANGSRRIFQKASTPCDLVDQLEALSILGHP